MFETVSVAISVAVLVKYPFVRDSEREFVTDPVPVGNVRVFPVLETVAPDAVKLIESVPRVLDAVLWENDADDDWVFAVRLDDPDAVRVSDCVRLDNEALQEFVTEFVGPGVHVGERVSDIDKVFVDEVL